MVRLQHAERRPAERQAAGLSEQPPARRSLPEADGSGETVASPNDEGAIEDTTTGEPDAKAEANGNAPESQMASVPEASDEAGAASDESTESVVAAS